MRDLPLLAVLLAALSGCSARGAAEPAAVPPAAAYSKPPLANGSSSVDEARDLDVSAHTDGRPGCMVVTASDGGTVLRSDAERCARRLRPYSTFKIPNSLIALETGVVEDESTVIGWNQQAYPKQSWWPAVWTSREHDLASAFQHSFVPYYRQAAARIGADRMARYVRQFRYGNQSIDGSIDSFWLDGGIAISADEQVRFLRDFYYDRLGVSVRTTRIVKSILVRERRGAHVFSAKTGSGDSPEGGALGWLVGYAEHGASPYFFAFHASGETPDAVNGSWRYETVGAMLGQLGIWPPPSPSGG